MITGAERIVEPAPTARTSAVPSDFDELYRATWWPMLRLAVGLVDEVSAAEDVVQDAFAAVYRNWDGIRDQRAAVGYLRTSVVNAARSVLRRRGTARKYLRVVDERDEPGADDAVLLSDEHRRVRVALAELPDRQREVLTLRYLAGLADGDIASATGLSAAGVRSAASRGLATLRTTFGGQL